MPWHLGQGKPSNINAQVLHAARSSGPGFLALPHFIYSSLLLFVFGSLLFGRMAGVPGQVDHVSKYASFGHDFRLFVLTL
jgi:hypothetical protein